MIKLELEGNYYEIGLGVGEKCKDSISHYSEECPKNRIDFAVKCQRSVEEHCPDLLEELQGIADGGDLNYEHLVFSQLAGELQSSCTLLAISKKHTKNGRPLFARSMDWFQDTLKFTAIFVTRPAGRLASLGFSDTFLGRLCGINEVGLAIGSSNTCWGNFQPGIMEAIATRWVLDTCRTVDEAVSFLRKIPHVMGNNFLIADKGNNFALVEAHPAKTVATAEQRDFLAAANHYFSPEFDEITPTKPKHSTDRIDYISAWFSNRTSPVDLEDVKTLQRTHDVEICPHVQEIYEGKLQDLTTCWAWIAFLGESRVHLCEGSPCKNQYTEHALI